MYINKNAGIQPNPEQQKKIESNSFSPKQLEGRKVQLSPTIKIAVGFAAISALAFAYSATYNYLTPVNPQPTGICPKLDHINRQLANPVKKNQKDFCTDPKTLFNEIYNSYDFKGISVSDMEKRFGIRKRSMSAPKAREFYNLIADANREFGEKAIKEFGTDSTILSQVAAAACETRHNAKVYTRTLSCFTAEVSAQLFDFIRHFSPTGQDCKALFKRYNHNATVILDKAASPNNDVNQFADNLEHGFIFAISEEFKHRLDIVASHLGA